MTPLADIEHACGVYARHRDSLARAVALLEEETARLRRKHMPHIKRLVGEAAEAEADLRFLVEDGAGHFARPKTRLFHGITVGYRKLKGSLSWADDAGVVARIERHFPEQFGVLVKTVRKPQKDALAKLAAHDLKRLGVSLGDDDDELVVKAADSEIDKAVDALLKAAGEAAP